MNHVTILWITWLPPAVVVLLEEGEKSEDCEKRHKSSHQVERACSPQNRSAVGKGDGEGEGGDDDGGGGEEGQLPPGRVGRSLVDPPADEDGKGSDEVEEQVEQRPVVVVFG